MYWAECMSLCQLVVWALVVHLVLLASVFDIHFRSPVIQNVEPVVNELHPPADRLVLFLGDGIRADTFYIVKDESSTAPFLRSVIEGEGISGISHAHVPTESRPGHVAIIAGMYEDPSAIFKGWQNYLVDFDSILNRSSASFSWGSPDIMNIFAKGSEKRDAYYFTYFAEDQELSGKIDSAEKLTTWVADNFESFVKTLVWDDRMEPLVRKKKSFFFFHFLGTDIAGHTSKPKSKEYKDNILAVDRCIYRIHKAINDFFKDEKTAFIFTSDHGMTDWGSHGDGTDAETLTPIVAWGAGIDFPQFKTYKYKEGDELYPPEWHLSGFKRLDINQADITPLMSILLGIPIPVNSVGILPINFLRGTSSWVYRALLLNLKQLRAQYLVREDMVKSKLLSFYFKRFPEPDMSVFLSNASHDFSISELIVLAHKACEDYIKGINYYKNYYSGFILSLQSFTFVGWMLKLCIEIVKKSKIGAVVFSFNFHYLNRLDRWDDGVITTALVISVLSCTLLAVQDMSFNFYIYVLLAITIWTSIIPNLKQMFSAFPLVDINRWDIAVYSAVFIGCLEFLVLAFKRRNFLCYAVVGLNIFWAFEDNSQFNFNCSFVLWFVSTLIMSMFPYLPTVGAYQNIFLVCKSGLLWFLVRLATICASKKSRTPDSIIQLVLIFVATCNSFFVDYTFSHKRGLLLTNQIISWTVLVASIIMLKFGPDFLHHKFIHLCHSLAAPFILLSSGHEGLFLCLLFAHLYIWISLEYYRFKEFNEVSHEHVMWGPKTLKFSDFRIAFFFLTYVLLGFFGLGNIASLNSFDPSWVRCYLTMFAPFTMMILIIFKTIVPIFMVTCSLRVIISVCQESLDIIFCIVFLFCDVMCLNFFLTVTNEGSWLEIGTSLSQFILMEVLTLFLLLFYAIALFIMPQKSRNINGFYLEELENRRNLNLF